MDNKQTEAWDSDFGIEYTQRNPMTVQEMDALYMRQFGVSRTDMNKQFLNGLDRGIRILEVGCSIGIQLMFLRLMGFKNLYGIELLPYAVELSKKKTVGLNIIQGNAFDIPFKDNYFDLVFTSGLLIHIYPYGSLHTVMSEIYRCSKRWIWGFEYYATKVTPIDYRGNVDLLWKADYRKIYCDYFKLETGEEKLFKYTDSEYRDAMFLLEKK